VVVIARISAHQMCFAFDYYFLVVIKITRK